jgi:multidrug efflux pump subunit AcrA (membrane-fusion protein)
LVVGLFLLVSCSEKQDIGTPVSTIEKTPFYVSVYNTDTDVLKTEVQKSGRITAKSSLTLTSKGVGEVANIEVKEGSQVKAGSVIARLKDTLTNYDLQLAQAENALKIQNATKETTSLNLEQ